MYKINSVELNEENCVTKRMQSNEFLILITGNICLCKYAYFLHNCIFLSFLFRYFNEEFFDKLYFSVRIRLKLNTNLEISIWNLNINLTGLKFQNYIKLSIKNYILYT